MSTFYKDPDAVLDYTGDWAAWLNGDTIQTSTWIPDDGITVDSSTHDDTTATVWLSGGTNLETYEVTNRVATAGGRTDDRTIKIKVKEK